MKESIQEQSHKLLSVTVPAYNAADYLSYCLQSMLTVPETLRSCLEILVIDDGSTDETGEIADRFAAAFPDSVRVIHKENGGHGSGINTGIREASGLYFKVIDADDWVDTSAFTALLSYLEQQEESGASLSDAVITGFCWAFDCGGDPMQFRRKAEIKEPFPGVVYRQPYCFDEVSDRIYLKMHALSFKTELLREHAIRLDEHCYYVDTEYMLYPIPYLKTICFLSEYVYQYRLGRQGQSVSPEKMLKNRRHYETVMHSLLSFYHSCRSGEIPCSLKALSYLENVIARVAAGNIKLLLGMPYGKKAKFQLITFDGMLKRDAPEIYQANRRLAVQLLRKSDYRLYPLAHAILMLRRKLGAFI